MTTTSKGPEGQDPHKLEVGVRLQWSRGAMRLVIAALFAAAGGLLAFLDKVIGLMVNVPVWAFMALLTVSTAVPFEQVSSVGLLLPALTDARASRFVTGDYSRARKEFPL